MSRPKLTDNQVKDLKNKMEGKKGYGMKYRKPLLERLNPEDVIIRMPTVFIGVKQRIIQMQRNNGPQSAVPTFISEATIYTGWADDFLQALVDIGQADLANFLHPGYAPQILASDPPIPDLDDSPPSYEFAADINPGAEDQIKKEGKYSPPSSSASNKILNIPPSSKSLKNITTPRSSHANQMSPTKNFITSTNTLIPDSLEPPKNDVFVVQADSISSLSAEYSNADHLDERIRQASQAQLNRIEAASQASTLSENTNLPPNYSSDPTHQESATKSWYKRSDTSLQKDDSVSYFQTQYPSQCSTQEETKIASTTNSDVKISKTDFQFDLSTSGESSDLQKLKAKLENKIELSSEDRFSENSNRDKDASSMVDNNNQSDTETKSDVTSCDNLNSKEDPNLETSNEVEIKKNSEDPMNNNEIKPNDANNGDETDLITITNDNQASTSNVSLSNNSNTPENKAVLATNSDLQPENDNPEEDLNNESTAEEEVVLDQNEPPQDQIPNNENVRRRWPWEYIDDFLTSLF